MKSVVEPPRKSAWKRERTSEDVAEERIQRAFKEGAEQLDLAGLGLTRLPESIGRLEKLVTLRVSHNPLTTLPVSLAQLKRLTGIDLGFTAFTAIPKILRDLPNLRWLNFRPCQLLDLPSWLGELRALRALDLGGSHLREMPEEIGQLVGLQTLDLSAGNLERLPEGLRGLPHLKQLFLHGNRELGIPPEVLGPSWLEVHHSEAIPADPAATLDYYFRTRQEVRPLNEARLILLGPPAVGKTSVVNRLVRDKFVETSRTEGIRSERWNVQLGEEQVKMQIWDFGGQEIAHATRQLFPTQRSLYVLVLAGRQGSEDADAEDGLQMIESFGGESPVIVVLNKMKEEPFALDYRGLYAKYPNIRGFIPTDCKDGLGLDRLRDIVERETAALQDLPAPFPAAWIGIQERVASMAERGERFIEYDTYRQICVNLGEPEAAAQDRLAGHLHALGIALNYQDDSRLHDTDLFSPHWVMNGIYSMLNWPGLAAQRGVLRPHDLGKVLDPVEYPRGKHLAMLNLMCRFEVCFAFPEDAQGRYLVPQLLGKERPALTDDFDPRECLNFQYHCNRLPEGLLPRFIVRTQALSEPEGRWRSGVVLAFAGNRALVRADAEAHKVLISVSGPMEGRRRLLAVIRSNFERIEANLPGLAVTEMVSVPGHPDWVVAYQDLWVFERSGVSKMPRVFDGQLVELDVPSMLAGVELKDTAPRPSRPLMQHDGLSVFISYSDRDEALRAELETHLKLLQRQGLISAWTDRRVIPGEKWGGRIDRHLETAEIVLVLLSEDFIASHYCFDIEMNRALERHEAGEAVVIPIIVRDVELRRLHFGHLPSLPQGTPAVTLWPDRDAAWDEVAAGLRKAVKNRRAREKTIP